MGPLLAKFRANFFMQPWNPIYSFMIFQQFSRSQPSFFPESNHPFFQLHATNITHHSGGIDKSNHIFFLNFGNSPKVPNFFQICLNSFPVYDCQFSHVFGSFLTLFIRSFIHLLLPSTNIYQAPTMCWALFCTQL